MVTTCGDRCRYVGTVEGARFAGGALAGVAAPLPKSHRLYQSGLELQRQLVAAHCHIPIIFVTAYADDDVRVRALAAGAVAFLFKPCREEDLLTAIEASLTHS